MDALIDGHSCHSYRALSKLINNWCSPWTIEKWLKAHPTYYIYSKNIKPGLSEPNKIKQVQFAKHVRSRWGLPPGKFLWIHSDEKWFHALVPRHNAKACAELGLKRQSYSVHHKSHIKKVMAHCTVGYLFDTNVEDGGQGFLIGLHRCANFKVPLRDVRHSSKDPVTGRITFAGNAIKHKKGEPYLVDCNVTGMNAGTTTSPCFPLRSLWEHSLFPAIKALVAHDGPCAGAQVIFQEDNAGPHTNHEYTAWMQEAFAQLGWKIELQAPQGHFHPYPRHNTFPYYSGCNNLYPCTLYVGPYTNVLDLQLFPSMSHRHSAQLQMYGHTEANIEQTWRTVETVWSETSSSEVARAFILAYRVMEIIIKEQGNNSFLSHGTPHCNVRRDYLDTPTGIERKLADLIL